MTRSLFCLFFVLTIFTRLIKLDWGNGYYFHPDENNMANSVSQLSFSNLNPHFFSYGQFPLYLAFFSLKLFNQSITFINSVFILRLWSAIFSSVTVYIFYLISNKIFKEKLHQLLFTTLIIFSPGYIQLAHFGTTESLLIFVFTTSFYLSLSKINKKTLISAVIISAIGLASKVTAIFFIVPILLLLVLNKKYKLLLIYIFSTLLLFLFLSPYNLLDFTDFISAINYETAVATGKNLVFYTHQFLYTTPYLFQFTHIFPYVLGIPIFILGLIGFPLALFEGKGRVRVWSLILVPSLIYFLYNAQLFTKWTRFMSPIFFIFPLFATYLFTKIKNKIVLVFLTAISLLPGIIFLNLYFQPDIRLTASDWINKNIKDDSVILSESGNVVNLPLKSHLIVNNFDFYKLDNINLATELEKSDYIIIPSRRVFKNYSYSYYQNMFNGTLGFSQIKQFSLFTDLILNSEIAEETWTVFDRPTIRIYQKTKQLTLPQYQQLTL